MKKTIVLSVILAAAMMACNNNDSKSKEESKEATSTENKGTASTDLSDNPDYQKGLELISKSDCGTCHKVDERVPNQGPSFREVANKYGGTSDTVVAHLGKKIITGGAGAWGEVAMIPHPQISQADAEAMVKYILLLKK
jgi:cytochrome c